MKTKRNLRSLGLVLPLAVVVLIGVFGHLLVPHDPVRAAGDARLPPGGSFLFGTDSVGFDVFSRTVAAFGVDLLIALMVTIAATGLGLLLGMFIGMNEGGSGPRGWAARAVIRGVDLADAVPPIIFGVVIVGLFTATPLSLSLALSFVLMQNQIRLTRVEVLKVRREAYLDAARMAGLSEARIVFKHVLPNSCRPALVNTSLVFGNSIIVLASLGFLGVGLKPPTPEWGSMISTGLSDLMLDRWWSALFPALALMLTVIIVANASKVLTRMSRAA